MLTVHRAAIRGEAARFYSAEIIDDWGPLPIRAENVGGLADRMIRGEEEAVVARDDATGRVVGFGSIVPAAEELRAVYVAPDHQRSGIGSMIVAELEARARKHGLSNLSMDASLNSERFYDTTALRSRAAASTSSIPVAGWHAFGCANFSAPIVAARLVERRA